MASVIPTKYPLLSDATVHCGDTPRSADPLYCDLAQAYLIAGTPWRGPCVLTGWEAPTYDETYTLYLPLPCPPGCAGWELGALAGWHLYIPGEDPAFPATILADVLDLAMVATLNAYTVSIEPLPQSDGNWAIPQGLWTWTGAQTYVVPPVGATPGLLSVAPAKGWRTLILRLTLTNVDIGALVARPVVSQNQVSSMA